MNFQVTFTHLLLPTLHHFGFSQINLIYIAILESHAPEEPMYPKTEELCELSGRGGGGKGNYRAAVHIIDKKT